MGGNLRAKRELITGDFNRKAPEWGETGLDKRRKIISDMVARNELPSLTKVERIYF